MTGSDPGAGASQRQADLETARFNSVYRTEAPWLIRFFRRRLANADEAQDLAQETMLRFMRAAPSIDLVTQQHYLRRIASNLLRDRFKSAETRFTQQSVPLIEGLDAEIDFDQHRVLASREELQEWERVLSRLKPRTLEIFLLSRVDDYTYNDIAIELGMTVWNVKRHMSKAIAHVERHRRAR